jgi:hypothetical protein
MPYEQYWIGRHVDLDQLWRDYDDGDGYIAKVKSTRLHLLRLTFSGHPAHLPLFDHEAIYKTVKGSFHDIKAECMSAVGVGSSAVLGVMASSFSISQSE